MLVVATMVMCVRVQIVALTRAELLLNAYRHVAARNWAFASLHTHMRPLTTFYSMLREYGKRHTFARSS